MYERHYAKTSPGERHPDHYNNLNMYYHNNLFSINA